MNATRDAGAPPVVAQAASLFAATVGAVVLAGWRLGIPVLMQILPGTVPMVPNTAVGFLLAGAALWLGAGQQSSSRLWASRAAAAAAGLLGLLTLVEFLSGRNLGIDELLFRDPAGLAFGPPDRMAVVTAVCFVAIAAALIVSTLREAPWFAEVLAIIPGLAAFVSLTEYIYGVRGYSWLGVYRGMAIHTALAFFALSVGVLLRRGDGAFSKLLLSDTAGGAMFRRTLPVVFGIPLLVGWLAAFGRRARIYGPELEDALISGVDAVLLFVLLWTIAERLRRVDEEKQQAGDALVESEEGFRTMVDAIPQLAWMAQPDGFIFWYNRRWYEFTGTTPKQMEGGGWQRVHDPEMLPKVLERWKGSIATGQPFEMDFPLRGADGRFCWFLTRVFPLKGASGQIVRWFGTNTDVSRKREAEEEIRLLNASLEERVAKRTADLETANKELEAFSYSVSHDLRAPLRGVDSFSRILLEDYAPKLDDEGKRLLNVVRGEAQRMGRLIDDLLSFSRLGRQEMRAADCDIAPLARSIFESLEVNNRAATLNVKPMPPAYGDPAMLRQVLFNLLSNAVKFSRHQTAPAIEFGGTTADGFNTYYVKDNGVGFDPRFAHKLFQVFQRLHTEEEFEGTGVGLALVQRIVQRHGGKVWAEGGLNQGAAFHFALPIRKGV